MASAQVKSCVLMAGLFATGRTTVREVRRTRDHTERMLSAFGVPLDVSGLSVSLEGAGAAGPRLAAMEIRVPGDFSSAAFWLAAAACRPGNEMRVDGVGLNPGRTALLGVLRRMGAEVEAEVESESGGEPIGSVSVRGARLRGTAIGGDEIPNLIDELPVISVLGALAGGVTTIRDAAELRVKESDRIAVMARNLRAVGIEVDESPDGMAIHGGRPRGGRVSSFLDHRIAMSFAVLGLYANAPLSVDGIECVATSYPGFMDHMEAVAGGRA
jgi:3-phosphoshikimate 1-carboxyvinyltransferase